MPSDPTTKDLIEAARKDWRHIHVAQGFDPSCHACLFTALADRLEEVEEEWAKVRAALEIAIEGLRNHVRKHADPTGEIRRTIRNLLDAESIVHSPEPSDPEPDTKGSSPTPLIRHFHASGVPDGRGPEKPPAQSTTEPDYPNPDPEPEDDPWEAVETKAANLPQDWSVTLLCRALRDLRERVEALESGYPDSITLRCPECDKEFPVRVFNDGLD